MSVILTLILFKVLLPEVWLLKTLSCTNPNLIRPLQIGWSLQTKHIQSFTSGGLMHCSRECVYHSNCLSFNFRVSSGRCELNRVTSNNMDNLIEDSGSMYGSKADWISTVAGDCAHITCRTNHKCIPITNGTKCVLVDCGVPPDMTYGSIADFSGTTIGYRATYSCFVNITTKVILTCNEDGRWNGVVCNSSQISTANHNFIRV
ncbi:hypothetical protein SNE40_016261 [Patella caerulea]|uniref:Apple domain-containing protein n=1 Tax=Patella caerulea TaxID=87958 RepID=A0AAN8P7Y3_PATCE